MGGKSVCEQKRNGAMCNRYITRRKHEYFKPYCPNCHQNKEIGHFCYMQPLKNELPRSDVLFVFYDFETTQDTKFLGNETEHIPILFSLQQFCTACEMQDYIDTDSERCGRRLHLYYEDPVGDLLSYICEPRPWCNKVVAITHNAKAFDSQFIIKGAILLKWNLQIILSELKIISMRMQHLHFLDSITYLPMLLRKSPKEFWLSPSKSWYPQYFNTNANLDYVDTIADIGYFAPDEMGREREGISCLGMTSRKIKIDNRRVLEQYCQDCHRLATGVLDFQERFYGDWKYRCFPRGTGKNVSMQ